MSNKRIAGIAFMAMGVIGFLLSADITVRTGMMVVAGIGVGLLMSAE